MIGKRGLIVISIIVILIAALVVWMFDLYIPTDVRAARSSKSILEEHKEEITDVGVKGLSRLQIITTMHEMSNTLIEADYIWGFIPITKYRVIDLMAEINVNSSITDKEKQKLLNILDAWSRYDFREGVAQHNYLWRLLDGNLGKARALNDEYKPKEHKDSNISLDKLKFTYPSNLSKRGSGSMIYFDDENKNVVGGIFIEGYYGSTSTSLPNHSERLAAEDIDTSLGKGKLFTLRRSHPAASNNDETWIEIHAIIPAENNLAYDFWIKDNKDILLEILKSLKK